MTYTPNMVRMSDREEYWYQKGLLEGMTGSAREAQQRVVNIAYCRIVEGFRKHTGL